MRQTLEGSSLKTLFSVEEEEQRAALLRTSHLVMIYLYVRWRYYSSCSALRLKSRHTMICVSSVFHICRESNSFIHRLLLHRDNDWLIDVMKNMHCCVARYFFILWCLIHLYAYVNYNRCCWRAHYFDAEWMHSASIKIESTAAYSSCCCSRV